ncbi:ATP-binding cassette domain-containing protein [Streptomyces paradoxus]|uniref:ATP-binding cassette domain-containing protein n=1 Tax=Streptomyces paradoxus TaxID=66375 RepID=UPI0037F6851D
MLNGQTPWEERTRASRRAPGPGLPAPTHVPPVRSTSLPIPGQGQSETIKTIRQSGVIGASSPPPTGSAAVPERPRRLLDLSRPHLGPRGNVALFARVFDVPRAERAERVTRALAAVDLAEAADRPAATYSGGMVRRLGLVQAPVSAPRLLILGEPTIGLDPIARTGVWEHIGAVREATGTTVLVTTHSMDEADQYGERVALMRRGRIRALGTPAEVRAGLGARRRAAGAAQDVPPMLEDGFRDVAGSGLDDEAGDFTPTPRSALITGTAFAAGVSRPAR